MKRRLMLVRELIRDIEAERAAALAVDVPDEAATKIVALTRIRGIGDIFAAVLTREVFYRRFTTAGSSQAMSA